MKGREREKNRVKGQGPDRASREEGAGELENRGEGMGIGKEERIEQRRGGLCPFENDGLNPFVS